MSHNINSELIDDDMCLFRDGYGSMQVPNLSRSHIHPEERPFTIDSSSRRYTRSAKCQYMGVLNIQRNIVPPSCVSLDGIYIF